MTAGPDDAAQAATGEERVRELYVDHYRRLVSLGHLMTGSNEVAEDLVQDCFARLLRRRSKSPTPAATCARRW